MSLSRHPPFPPRASRLSQLDSAFPRHRRRGNFSLRTAPRSCSGACHEARPFLQVVKQEDGSDSHSSRSAVMRRQFSADLVPPESSNPAFTWRFRRKKDAIAPKGRNSRSQCACRASRVPRIGTEDRSRRGAVRPTASVRWLSTDILHRGGSGQRFHLKEASSGPGCTFPWETRSIAHWGAAAMERQRDWCSLSTFPVSKGPVRV